jgi:hypothetical protein
VVSPGMTEKCQKRTHAPQQSTLAIRSPRRAWAKFGLINYRRKALLARRCSRGRLPHKAIGEGKQSRKTSGYCRPRAPLALLIDEAQQGLGVIHPACQAPFGSLAAR